MDAATALSGCGPAFFALVVEALVDAGVRARARRATRRRGWRVETMAGTAELLRGRDGDTRGLRRAVTSPGGVTAARARRARGARACARRSRAAVDAVVEARRRLT